MGKDKGRGCSVRKGDGRREQRGLRERRWRRLKRNRRGVGRGNLREDVMVRGGGREGKEKVEEEGK